MKPAEVLYFISAQELPGRQEINGFLIFIAGACDAIGRSVLVDREWPIVADNQSGFYRQIIPVGYHRTLFYPTGGEKIDRRPVIVRSSRQGPCRVAVRDGFHRSLVSQGLQAACLVEQDNRFGRYPVPSDPGRDLIAGVQAAVRKLVHR